MWRRTHAPDVLSVLAWEVRHPITLLRRMVFLFAERDEIMEWFNSKLYNHLDPGRQGYRISSSSSPRMCMPSLDCLPWKFYVGLAVCVLQVERQRHICERTRFLSNRRSLMLLRDTVAEWQRLTKMHLPRRQRLLQVHPPIMTHSHIEINRSYTTSSIYLIRRKGLVNTLWAALACGNEGRPVLWRPFPIQAHSPPCCVLVSVWL
jgi:hypothetical protein